ncbi:MAG: PKD domain-containing protein, partial [Fibrobacterota bacterium]
QSKGLEYMASNTPVFPEPWGMTNIVQALDIAKQRLDADVDRPVQRNVILLSDGAHNVGPIDPKTGEVELPSVNLGRDGAYRIFVIALNVEPDVDSYGKIMQDLASNSVGPEGAPGRMIRVKQAYAAGELAAAVKQINDDINGYNYEAGVPTTLYRDAAATDFPITFDAGQTSGHFSIAWVGNVAPTLTLTAPPPAAQTYQEANYTGIKFTNGNHLKSFDVDLTKFAPGTWILRAKSLADNPVIVVPSIALKSSKLAVNVRASTGSIYPDGKLPISVVVKDGQAIQGLKATGSLINRLTGIVSSVDLTWNGSSYSASIVGLQPGINDLTVTVKHPGTNTVFLAQGENRVADAQRKSYPAFSTRKVSQEIWVPSKAVRKTVGVEAWMINTAVNNPQGTTMKLYLRNNTAYSMTGLKVRYFFSVSEYPNGVPGVNKNYLPQSVVKVGTVAGRPGLGYLEFDFAGKTLLPNAVSSNGQNGGENVSAIEANWSSAARWNPTNDWSAQGLTSSWAQNPFVNIYDASGALIAGNPDLEPRAIVKNAAPLIAISSSDLLVAGTPVQFTADAVDPEGDALVYTWKVDGVTVTSNPGMPNLMTATLTAGAHTISGSVSDAQSKTTVTDTKKVMVQSATNACTTVQDNLGAASSNTNLPLAQGVNCFVIHSGAMATEWNWTNVQFQLNSDNGVALTGVSVTPILTGVTTSLSGYSQTVSTANPGSGKPLYLKVVSPTARAVRSNWWLK